MKQKTKASLVIIAILLGAIATAHLIASSNQIYKISQLVILLLSGTWGLLGILGLPKNGKMGDCIRAMPSLGLIFLGIFIVLGILVGGKVLVVVGAVGVIILLTTYDKETKTFDTKKFLKLSTIFLIPILVFTIPLSRHHNTNQLEKDNMIMTILEISPKEITLPAEHIENISYIEEVLIITIDEKTKFWKDVAIPHIGPYTIGSKKWYTIPFLENTTEVTLFFNHCWEDKKVTIQL